MAAYNTDLTDITDAESGTVVEPAAPYDGGLVGVLNTELYIQNTSSFSSEGKNAVGNLTNGVGTLFNSTQTFASEEVVLGWGYFAFPTDLYSKAGRGWSFLIGSSISAYDVFTVGGDDVTPFPYGGWYNYAIDPTQTETVVVGGGNGGTYTHFGFGAFLRTKISKGDCMAMDALRKGRAEIYCTGTACTFTGMATENDAVANRWGLFQDVGGSYLWKGLMSFGQTATAATFSDSNKTISIDNMEFVYSAFNKIEFHHVDTDVTLNNISFNSTSTVSPGDLEMIANCTLALTACIFNAMGIFTFDSGATITASSFNSCGLITTGGATFTGCTFDEPTGAVGVTATSPADAALITESVFNSDGTGNGLEITGTAADMTLTDVDFSGYSTSVDANKAIYVNIASGSMTINISGGSGVTADAHVRTAGATVTVVSGQATLLITARDQQTQNPVEGVAVTIGPSDNTGPFPWDETVTITRVTTTATVAHTAHGMVTGQKVAIAGANQNEYNRIKTITVTTADAYTFQVAGSPTTPATGTIKATAVIIDGLTNASGVISDTRTYGSDQPIAGSAKKGSEVPTYIPGSITGTVDSANGLTVSTLLILDD